MSRAITKALERHQALVSTASSQALQLKQAGIVSGAMIGLDAAYGGVFGQFQEQAAQQRRYQMFRGWVHAAVNALAMEGAGQPVRVGRIEGQGPKKELNTRKSMEMRRASLKVPAWVTEKSARQEVEIMLDHPLIARLDKPNQIQYRWQFVYSFIASLCLTGWAYIVADENDEGETELFVLPTSWVFPDHSKGAFAEYRIMNPKNPMKGMEGEPLRGDQVAFAHLPDPSDPLSALSLAQAQSKAIQIDDRIQYSQTAFFENGIFPSVIITMGKNAHPEQPGTGTRPRLTASQRRQVNAAIRKVSGGVANYGNPAIIDGLIERIDRLSMDQQELGWEKSEKTNRSRILSAFGVHPFILGEEMAGSYAQAYVVQERFCKRVNTFLGLLGTVLSEFIGKADISKEKVLIWWEECKAVDPSMEQSTWDKARQRDDISQNEYRAKMGLPPDEDKNQQHLQVAAIGPVANVASLVAAGKLAPEQAVAILTSMGLPDDIAKKISGKGTLETALPPPPAPGGPGAPAQGGSKALALLSTSTEDLVERVLEAVVQ